jgi:peptidoglycan LD-endopeptidase LytH
MRDLPLPRTLLLLALGVVLVLPLIAPLPVGAQSLDQARRDRQAIQVRLDAAVEKLAELEARIGTLDDEARRLQGDMDALAVVADEADRRVAARVRELYKRGIDLPILQMLLSDDAGAAIERIELASHLLAGDRVEFEQAHTARVRMGELAEQLADRQAELDAAHEEMRATLADLQDDFRRAAALEQRLHADEQRRQAEAARRAAAAARAQQQQRQAQAAVTTSGAKACPIGRPHSFTDTWGAPRSGGRAHKGVDMLANYGIPIYAIVDGVWNVRSYGRSAGNWAILRGSDGHNYYYMHLQQHLVGNNTRVRAGQQVATNGDTGNARGTPHLHFEYHPHRGGPVNPTPLVRSVC